MLPLKVLNKYLSRFDKLIAQGEEIQKNVKVVPGNVQQVRPYGTISSTSVAPDKRLIDFQSFRRWETNCNSLLEQIIPSTSIHRKILQGEETYLSTESKLKDLISILKALKEDLELGFLDNLENQIEAAIAADYMGQAESLLNEGQAGKYDHVPAAVLSGAVLEKALRTLCHQQTPPISTSNTKGEPLTLNPLIDVLKKAGTFNELKAKQLRAWADVRNKAAHGEFDQFSRSDVETMIKGIEEFLATYMA